MISILTRIGLTKKVTVGIQGDAKQVAEQLLDNLSDFAGQENREGRRQKISQTKSRWLQELTSMDHEDDDEGTTWNERARNKDPELMEIPRMAWRAIQEGATDRSDYIFRYWQ